jgi:DNA-binding NtrC family response regulator
MTRKVDVRIISATNRDIEAEVKEGRFREDIYYRLNVVQIHMPPLRERRGDIRMVAEYFLGVFQQERGCSHLRISESAMQKMVEYEWPGNIRELRNALERAVVMGNGKEILTEDLPISGARPSQNTMEVGMTLKEAEDNFKKRFIKLT